MNFLGVEEYFRSICSKGTIEERTGILAKYEQQSIIVCVCWYVELEKKRRKGVNLTLLTLDVTKTSKWAD